MAYRFINPQPVYTDGNGDPLNGGKLYFYSIGTSTLKDTYTTSALSVANTNPIVLDSSGRPTDEIWLNGDYRMKLTDSTGATTYFDVDPYREPANATGVQNSSYTWGGTAGGSANALTITPTPVITAYSAGQEFEFIVASNNTSSATLNVNSVGAIAITKNGTEALVANDLIAGQTVEVKYDGTRFQLLSAGVAALKTSTTLGQAALLTGTHTIPILASAMFSRTTNGAAGGLTELATNDVMLASKDFDQTTSEAAQFYVPMPKSWNEGTVTAQFGWTAASGTGTVTWSIAGTAFSDDDAMDTAFSGAQSVTDTLITANDMHITSVTSAITIAGTPAESDFVIFQITRDVSDTLNADAKLIWCKIFLSYASGNDS